MPLSVPDIGHLHFPLYEKARRAGVLETGKGLIVAPTATGKSYIGRSILESAVQRGDPGLHAYLVPYRALAGEMYESFRKELEQKGIRVRLKIATGDHRDPFYPEETDILVATYERFSGLISTAGIMLGRLVIDEIHMLADETRGAGLESLIARLRSGRNPASICALSAVVANPKELAAWLGVPLVMGSAADRAVQVEFHCDLEDSPDARLAQEVVEALEQNDQAIVFCRSKASAQRTAEHLSGTVRGYLSDDNRAVLSRIVAQLREDEDAPEEIAEFLEQGVCYHHAGLTREARAMVEDAFRERHLKVICCTPTLAAGVNLPARLVVVRDVYRSEYVRGRWYKVTLSTGELLNMLGRAGRPGQVLDGRGLAIVEPGILPAGDVEQLRIGIRQGRGNEVLSQLPQSFDSLMRFVLQVISDRSEATLGDIAQALEKTLWYHVNPKDISFDRPIQADIMEDIPAFERVDSSIKLLRVWPMADGVSGVVQSGSKTYDFTMGLTGETCTCPAKSKWQRGELCKHLACALNSILFGFRVDPEVRSRALYVSARRFVSTLDPGSMIKIALDLLTEWNLLTKVPGAYRVTPVGAVAANSSFDVLLVRIAQDRLRACNEIPPISAVAEWLVEDFYADEKQRGRWASALSQWIDEVDEKRVRLPEPYRGDFEQGLERLGDLSNLYAEVAAQLGKPALAERCREARGCIVYGVHPDIVPLAALRIRRLGRARCRILNDQKGIRNLEGLASADPCILAHSRIPPAVAAQFVTKAKEIAEARNRIRQSEDPTTETDVFLAQFMVDRLLITDNKVTG